MGSTVQPPARFEVSSVTVRVAGPQPSTVDAHLVTRATGRHRWVEPMLTITLSGLMVHCLDLAAVTAFADTWTTAAAGAERFLPCRGGHGPGAPGYDRNQVGVLLRLAGRPDRLAWNFIPAGAAASGSAHVRATVAQLTVLAHDLDAVHAWAQTWEAARSTAASIWPEPDAFSEAEARDRNRIARAGIRNRST
ncbi:MAG TPA: hypothetical protein VHV82_21290 [Sporichthyaceae bacterium]|jgi:hypothetical protein|nr:hypothetical protein [Sporichthyaceae bacterium]